MRVRNCFIHFNKAEILLPFLKRLFTLLALFLRNGTCSGQISGLHKAEMAVRARKVLNLVFFFEKWE